MSELRHDPIHDHRVILAPDRLQRPNAIRARPWREDNPEACPFCRGRESQTPQSLAEFCLPGSSEWTVRAIPNLYPIVGAGPSDNDLASASKNADDEGMGGRHEVIIESPQHVERWFGFSTAHVRLILDCYQRRLRQARADQFAYALLFKNQGQAAGASQYHVHSQLIALEEPPPTITAIWSRLAEFSKKDGCWHCRTIQHEIARQDRLVAASEHFVAWCPEVSRAAYETWIAPREHLSHFDQSDHALLDQLAPFLSSILTGLENSVQHVAFNLAIHSSRFDTIDEDHYHWNLVITPRIAGIAGFELSTGIFINPVPPELAAAQLRTATTLTLSN